MISIHCSWENEMKSEPDIRKKLEEIDDMAYFSFHNETRQRMHDYMRALKWVLE
jgi:hypothetical protein